MTPLQIVGIVSGMGLGEQATTAVVIGLILIYLFRGKRVAGTILGVFGTVWVAAVSVGVVFVVAILAGWVDPNPAAFVSDVLRLIALPFELIGSGILDAVGQFFSRFS